MYEKPYIPQRRLSRETICFYAGLGLMGLMLVIVMIIGSVSVHNYKSTPNCLTKGESDHRLPRSILPISYRVHVKPDMSTFKFEGQVEIHIVVKQDTTCIVLNALDLNFGSSNVALIEKANTKKTVKLANFKLDADLQKLHLTFARRLQVGEEFILKIAYDAKLRDDFSGFYKSTYTTKGGATKYIANTQFESTSARAAFPCFDNPNFKAQFNVTITLNASDASKENMRALSNMPQTGRTTLADGSVSFEFETSPIMSPYLVAFVVGEFEYVEATEDDILIRIYSIPGDGEKGKFQLDVARKVTKFLNTYTGIKFPIPKMDLVGIPDFRGAMENWGLLIFRGSILTVDNTTSQEEREANAEVVSHEISHQWTGDLVTCNWWSHIWLNEGFATFFESFALDAVHPEFNRWRAKLSEKTKQAYSIDALPSSHAIINNADTPYEIYMVFDQITYGKGGAVLYMIYNAIGPQHFQTWMRTYFNKYQYKNTETYQFLEILNRIEGVAVTQSQVSTWTNNPGFPVITVRYGSDGKVSLEQKRFFSRQPLNSTTSTADATWWVPITIMSSTGQIQKIDLNDKEMENALTLPSGSWIKLNNNQTGFYRVNYPTELWLALFQQMKEHNNLLSTEDRFGIVDDVFALTFAGELTVTAALKLVPYMKSETTFMIWNTVLEHLDRISALISKEPINGHFNRLIADLVKQKYDELGWDSVTESESEEDAKLRVVILSAATKFELKSSRKEAIDRFDKFVEDEVNNNIDSKLRPIIYKTVVSEKGEEGYYEMLNRFHSATNASNHDEAKICLFSLAWARDPAMITNTLELALSKSVPSSQDTINLIKEVSNNPYGNDIAWNFVREYYSVLEKKVGQRIISYFKLAPGMTAHFTTRTKYEEAKSFFTPRDKSKFMNEALETILVNEQFLKKNYNELRDYLQKNYPYERE